MLASMQAAQGTQGTPGMQSPAGGQQVAVILTGLLGACHSLAAPLLQAASMMAMGRRGRMACIGGPACQLCSRWAALRLRAVPALVAMAVVSMVLLRRSAQRQASWRGRRWHLRMAPACPTRWQGAWASRRLKICLEPGREPWVSLPLLHKLFSSDRQASAAGLHRPKELPTASDSHSR